MQLRGPCSCVDLASMLRQACGQGQKVDLAAQEGTLLGQQEACQELLGCQEACQEACQACQETARRPGRRPARRPCLATWQKVGLQEGLDSSSGRPEATKA